jgi:deoxyribodipyrimidine photo-lyase
MTEYDLSLFIFRRDLRLDDNIGLIAALAKSKKVIPIFILTPEQLINNKYKSDNCVQFMIENLKYLDELLRKKGSKLFYMYGNVVNILQTIHNETNYNAIFVNQDYTPYSIKRDKSISEFCNKKEIAFESYEDVLLNPIKSITNTQGMVYTKFTPYFRKARKVKIDKPVKCNKTNFVNINYKLKSYDKTKLGKFYKENPDLAFHPKDIVKKLTMMKKYKGYNLNRNNLTYETTGLSVFIKFGTASIRQVYYAMIKHLGTRNELIKQLYWREFYYNVAFTHPYIFSKKGNLNKKYDKIDWWGTASYFNKWKNANTGFPVVDACMRQMNTTGFMHNRGRLIVASFLVKILLVDWKKGEKYFATKLIDYDPSVNTGNWGWVAGSGADAQPYFRIFNPWLQSAKYDPDAEYIKKWIPELSDVPPNHIHKWYDHYLDYKDIKYSKPMVSYEDQVKEVRNMYGIIY